MNHPPGLFGGPLDEARNAAYWNSMTKHYAPTATTGLVRYTHLRQHEAALKLGGSKRHDSVIDVGAGTGLLTQKLLEVGCYVTATDASPAMVDHLKSITEKATVARAEHLDLGQTFDQVYAIGILNFVTDPVKTLERLASHVCPGGVLVLQVTEYSFFGITYWLNYVVRGFRPYLFSLKFLCTALEKSGLSFERCRHPLPHDLTISFRKKKTT